MDNINEKPLDPTPPAAYNFKDIHTIEIYDEEN
jgi:hypothetical protein